MTEVLRLHGRSGLTSSRALTVFTVEAILSVMWALSLTFTIGASVVSFLLEGDAGFAPVIPGFWHFLCAGLFCGQTAMAMFYDNHDAPLPWRYFPLCLLYPLYFAIVVLPAGLAGWPAGIFSTNTSRWDRSERVS